MVVLTKHGNANVTGEASSLFQFHNNEYIDSWLDEQCTLMQKLTLLLG